MESGAYIQYLESRVWKFNAVSTGSEDPDKEQLDHNWTRLGYQPIRLFPQLGKECSTAAANGAKTWFG